MAPGFRPDESYSIHGLKAFLYTPEGKSPSAAPEQMISGVRFLRDLEDRCATEPGFDFGLEGLSRRRLNRIWGKHAMGLAIRTQSGWRSRWQLFLLGMQFFRRSLWIRRAGHSLAAGSDRRIS